MLKSKNGGKKFMKIKSKLILAASSLLVLSGVAAGTSTFAWFTANQTATAEVTSIGVNTNTDELSMAVTAEDTTIFPNNTGEEPDSLFVAATDAENDQLTDVSGSGVDLYKGTVDTDGVVGGSYTIPFTAPYCFNFDVTFTNSNPDKAMAVFLSSTSSINPTTEADENDEALAKSMRVAILNSAKNESLAYYAPNDSATSQILTGTGGALSTSNANASDLDLTTNDQNILLSDYTTDYTDDTATTTADAKGYIGTIPATQSLQVTARIWIEGTDADCDNVALTGNVGVNLVFNGVSNIVTA